MIEDVVQTVQIHAVWRYVNAIDAQHHLFGKLSARGPKPLDVNIPEKLANDLQYFG